MPWQRETAAELARAGVQRRRGGQLHQHGARRRKSAARRRQGGDRELSAARPPAHRAGAGRARRAGRARPGARHGVARGAAGDRARRAGGLARQARHAPSSRVAAVLTLEPERSANFFNIAPRADDEHRRCAGDRADPDRQPRRPITCTPRASAEQIGGAREGAASRRLARGQRIDNAGDGPAGGARRDRARAALPRR